MKWMIPISLFVMLAGMLCLLALMIDQAIDLS